ncbi:heme exporter protein D [Cognatiyoonia koreensis]|uniref:Heme exporter protein D n=1 Tax=Cognatiyoonia koreensis TaxID=364200 RepID=A0A1I0NPL0_9RHOB|nr:heme exporter protein D [Cognatiyoonia koreensis]
MPDLGKYATEVLLAYGISIALLVALVLVVWSRSRKAKKALEEIENG